MSMNRQPEPQDSSTVSLSEADEAQCGGSDLTGELLQCIESPIAFGVPADNSSARLDCLLSLPDEGFYPVADIEMLESGKPLSQCMLWPLMESYYDTLGTNAWETAVPCFVTSSSVIAEAYAESIIAYLEECFHAINLDEPLYILEMATGIGRFSFLLLYELERKLAYFPHLAKIQLRYIMTDFTQNNIDFWRSHEKFAPFLQRGTLDFARFRPEEERVLHLQVSGLTLDSTIIKNPVIGLANYFFDTIRQDVFKVSQGQLYEGLVDLSRPVPPEGTSKPACFDELIVQYNYNPVLGHNYYDDPSINQVLQEYCQRISDGHIIFPLGALSVINNLKALSNNNLMLLSSDKSFTTVEHMCLYSEHRYAFHGSISFMVNYDAVGRLFQQSGGHYFCTSNQSLGMETICCVLSDERQASSRFDRLRYYFAEKLDAMYPIVTTYTLTDEMLSDESAKTPKEQIAIHLRQIKLNLYDPRAFSLVAPKLVPIIHAITMEQRNDLLKCMRLCEEKWYFYRGEQNLLYWFGIIYAALGLFQESIDSFELAKQGYSEYNYEYLTLQGNCYMALKQWNNAMQAYLQALTLNPIFENAINALNALRTFLNINPKPEDMLEMNLKH